MRPTLTGDTRDAKGGLVNVTMLLPVLLVEPDRLSRIALQSLLTGQGFSVMSVETGGEAISAAGDNRFSLMMSETLLPDVSFVELVRRVRQTQPLKVALITGETDRKVLVDALTVRPCAVLSKYADPHQLTARLVLAFSGGLILDELTYEALHSELAAHTTSAVPRLPMRELQVLDGIAAGLSLSVIARRLHLAESTVKTHASRAATRLNVTSSKQAAELALRHGLFDVLETRISKDPFRVNAG